MRNGHVMAVLAIVILAVSAASPAAEEAKTCRACGQAIQGAYFETHGLFYHSNHFTCHYCREPITGKYSVYHKNNYHADCFEDHVALRCGVCAGMIQGQYMVDYWGNAYHPFHEGDVSKCDFCNRFIVGSLADGMKRFDNRFLCGGCSATAVTNPDVAMSLMVKVWAQLKKVGIEVDATELQIHLVSRRKIQQLHNKFSHGLRGLTDYREKRSFFGGAKSREIKIYLLRGMPRTEMIGTLAHELMHVWQFDRSRHNNNKPLSEGSCNFASYLVLRKIRNEHSDYFIRVMMDDQDPVYGEGFRRVKKYVEANGLPAWLGMLQDGSQSLSGL